MHDVIANCSKYSFNLRHTAIHYYCTVTLRVTATTDQHSVAVVIVLVVVVVVVLREP